MTILEISDADLERAFGPQWREVVALVRRVAVLTPEEINQIAAAWDAAWGTAEDVTWGAARDVAAAFAWDADWGTAEDVAWGAARDAARAVAWDAARAVAWDVAGAAAGAAAAWDAAWGTAEDVARAAAWDAAGALAIRDLISPDGFTQAHYTTLAAPLAAVGIRLHPDD